MQYTYELRDRAINSPSHLSVLDEMASVLKSHVFLDKGVGPIERGYGINYYLPEQLILELTNVDDRAIESFRRTIYNRHSIPRETVIRIYDKGNLIVPVLVLGRSSCKISLAPYSPSPKPISRSSISCS